MADAGIFIDQERNAREHVKEVKPKKSARERFVSTRRVVGKKISGLIEHVKTIASSAPADINLDSELEQIADLQKRQQELDNTTERQIGREGNIPAQPDKDHAFEGDEKLNTENVLEAIQNIIKEDSEQRLAKIEGSTKITRFLERDERDWRDADRQASIINYALEIDGTGRIIGRKSLIINKDGDIYILHAKLKGQWRSESREASAADMQEALDSMSKLHKQEGVKNYLDNVTNGGIRNLSNWERPNKEAVAAPNARLYNLELLHAAGEVGESLIPYYEYALRIAPELADIKITRNDNVPPMAKDSFKDGRHQVIIPLGATSPNTLRDKFSSGSRAHIAQLFGMQPEELTQRPDLIHTIATIHEMGHVVQYKQYESNPNAFKVRRQQEIQNLPVPGQNDISILREALKDKNSSQSIWVREHWGELQRKYNVQNIDDVITLQAKAKRTMFHERFADEFALKVIKGVEQERIGSRDIDAARR